MKTVIIASENPVKIAAVTKAFERFFPGEVFNFEGIAAVSGVPDQPKGDDETLRGAQNRATNAKLQRPNADYVVGLEGGIATTNRGTEAFAWMCVLDKAGKTGLGKTGSFYLPDAVTRLLEEGMELGEADDRVFSRVNSKHSNGSVGILTHDLIDRTAYYTDAVIFALIPFANPELYFE